MVSRNLKVLKMSREIKKNGLDGLLAALKTHHSLADYNLTLYENREDDRVMSCDGRLGLIAKNPIISEVVTPHLKNHILDVIKNKRPVVRRVKGGLFCFFVPVRVGREILCVVGEGVREKSIFVAELEDLCRASETDVFHMIEIIEALPVRTFEDVKLDVAELLKKIACFSDEMNHLSLTGRPRNQLASILRKISLVNEMKTSGEVVSLSGEVLKEIFSSVQVAIVLRDENNGSFSLRGINGPVGGTWSFPEKKLSLFIKPDSAVISVRLDKETGELFHLPEARKAACFSLEIQKITLGFIAVIDHEPDMLDEQLTRLLANRITAKLHTIKIEEEKRVVGSLSKSLMSLANILLFAESKEELYRNILEISANLVRASRGSIMLVDNNGRNLRIAFCKGMNWELARSITVEMGEGIAGGVAKSGMPLLVDDVEKDGRVRMANRPRFKSKSLLCVPLKFKEKTIGVLNLSDKENLERFTDSDLDMLASFADLASLMIERAWTLERSTMLEKLSVTDFLTGLYNHRFLRKRLEEELSRSARCKANVTVVFIDLDFFKIYNDLNGHLAGDAALRKTADILKSSVRDMDFVARYGGEEFCIVLPDTGKEEAELVAERIRREIELEKFLNEVKMPFGCLTASFGIATFPEDGHTYTSLLHSADLALYSAKTGGRNRIVLGRPAMANGNDRPLVPDGI